MPNASTTEADAPLIRHTAQDGSIVISVLDKPEGLLVVRTETQSGPGSSMSSMISLFQSPQEIMRELEQDPLEHEHPLLWALLKRDLEALY